MKKKLYLLLASLGIVVPYTQFVPYTTTYGFDFRTMIELMFANQIASGIAWDALLTAVVVIIYILLEQKTRPVKHIWIPLVGMFAVGLAFALPAYLYLREISLARQDQ